MNSKSTRRKTQEEFENEINKILGDAYVVLGEYTNTKTKIEMLHKTCNNTFFKLPKDALRGSGCPFCYGARPALYNEQWVKDNTPLPYHYINGYTGMTSKCNFYCDNCQKIFQQSPSRLIVQGIYGCSCSPTKKKTHNEFLNELGENCLNEYEIMNEYINYDTKMQMRHKTCGTMFDITPDKFVLRYNKKYCPVCYYKKSRGEIDISIFLTKNQISYQTNFTFSDFKLKLFDFYLPDYNICIEYDGEQHFKPIDYFGGVEAFVDTQRRDREKDAYCIRNNIKLFRIPYWDKNKLETILQKIIIEDDINTIDKYLVTENQYDKGVI